MTDITPSLAGIIPWERRAAVVVGETILSNAKLAYDHDVMHAYSVAAREHINQLDAQVLALQEQIKVLEEKNDDLSTRLVKTQQELLDERQKRLNQVLSTSEVMTRVSDELALRSAE